MAARDLTLAAEGLTDQVVLERLAALAGWSVASRQGGQGKHHLLKRISAYNRAALHAPWVVLIDLDSSAPCAPELLAHLEPAAPLMRTRVAVRALEAWLLADRRGIADFMRVARDRIPIAPETLPHPKQTMVNIAARSRDSSIRRDMVPRSGAGRGEGPAYASRLQEFALEHWNVHAAAEASPSLGGCLAALRSLAS